MSLELVQVFVSQVVTLFYFELRNLFWILGRVADLQQSEQAGRFGAVWIVFVSFDWHRDNMIRTLFNHCKVKFTRIRLRIVTLWAGLGSQACLKQKKTRTRNRNETTTVATVTTLSRSQPGRNWFREKIVTHHPTLLRRWTAGPRFRRLAPPCSPS